MPPKKRIAPIPSRWITPVVEILRDGDIRNIRWTFTAESEFPLFGFISKEQAYEYGIDLLLTPGIHGEMVTGMYAASTAPFAKRGRCLANIPSALPSMSMSKSASTRTKSS